MIRTHLKSLFSVSVIFLLFYFAGASPVFGASQVVLTWRSEVYRPAGFNGKAPAVFGAPITVSAQILSENKLVSPDNVVFDWYADGRFLKRGKGLKQIAFTVNKPAPESYLFRTEAVFANEKAEAIIRVPIEKPKITIEKAPIVKGAKDGLRLVFTAVPYFFNIASLRDLNFFWNINGQNQVGRGNQLSIKFDSEIYGGENNLKITTAAQNSRNFLETAKTVKELEVAGQEAAVIK